MRVDLESVLNSAGMPVAYRVFKTVQKPPYVIYYLDNTENIAADDKVYMVIENYRIELYSERRDKASEKKIEDALNLNEIIWDKSDDYLTSEKVNLVTYSIQI